MNPVAAKVRIRPATSSDVQAICALVQADRFQEDGSGALLPVSADQVSAILEDASRGTFFVAERMATLDQADKLVGCVSVVIYGLPQGYQAALDSLRLRLATGTPKRHWANLKVLAEGEVASDSVAELRSLVVSGSQRGTGVGADLIQAAKSEAKRRGFAELYSLVNDKVVGLFERYGFQRAEGTPQKLAVDCAHCLILERCNEVPVVARL